MNGIFLSVEQKKSTFEPVIPLNMKTLLITILAFVSIQLNAQTWVQVPDLNFQNYLTAHYPVGAFMTSGGNFFIDADHADVQAEDSLDVSNQNLSSIEGVQAFENLIYLKCSYNQLGSIPVLPLNLQSFYCRNNLLTVLPNLPSSLALFDCADNQITNLPFLPNTLFYMDCSNNQLTTLPVLPGSLYNLACSANSLTDLPALPPYLGRLNCVSNELDSLPSLPNYLQTLFCSSNHLITLPDIPNSLQEMDCQENQLIELPDLPESLLTLICDSNHLTVLPDLPNSMTFFSCIRNSLTEIVELPQTLQSFYCYNNHITCFAEFPSSIQNLNIDNNPFTCLPNYIPAMGSLILAYPLCEANDPVNNPYGCAGATGIEGTVFHDANSNCISTGQTLTYVPMSLFDSNGTLVKSSTSLANGDYYFSAVPGTYALSIDTANLTQGVQVTCPVGNSSAATVPVSDTIVAGGDFGLVCNGFDLGVQSIVDYDLVFPGQTHGLSILAGDLTAQYNMYCASGISGEVTIAVTGPGTVSFGGSPTNVSGNSAVYSIADFGAINANQFALDILTDTTAVFGDEFCVTVSVATAASGELDASNNLYSYCYEVVNSYDPNIKQTYPGVVEPGFDDEFTYTIYFQNTGSAPAFNIRLADTLDANLDLKTFKAVNASHDFNTVVNAYTRLLTVHFPDIMLPDSTTDPQGSIGFIQYRVKPLSGLTNGTVIHNTAYIYFDYNAPIVTNTTENVFFTDLGLGEWNEETIQLYPNPAENEFLVRAEREIDQITLSDINGKQVVVDLPHVKTTSVNVSDLKQGIYLVTIKTNQSVITKRLIVR